MECNRLYCCKNIEFRISFFFDGVWQNLGTAARLPLMFYLDFLTPRSLALLYHGQIGEKGEQVVFDLKDISSLGISLKLVI